MSKGWFPCCSNCIIHRDLFDRADGDSLGAGWTEYAGDADIKDEEADLRQDDTIVYSNYYDSLNPDDDGHVIYAKVYGNEDGVQLRLIAGAVLGEASDAYWFGELQYNTANATLRLYHHSGGTDTEHGNAMTIGIPLGTQVPMCLSLVPESSISDHGYVETTVTYGGNEYGVRSDRVLLPTHEKAGFGCGTAATSAGDSTVDDWQGRRSSMDPTVANCPDCPLPNCGSCLDNEAPQFLQVEILDADTSPACCEDIEGTYVLSYRPSGIAVCGCDPGTAGCFWEGEMFDLPCGTQQGCIGVHIFYDSVDDETDVYVYFGYEDDFTTGTDEVRLKYSEAGDDFDCLSMDELQVSTVDATCPPSPGGSCSTSSPGIKAKITSL